MLKDTRQDGRRDGTLHGTIDVVDAAELVADTEIALVILTEVLDDTTTLDDVLRALVALDIGADVALETAEDVVTASVDDDVLLDG